MSESTPRIHDPGNLSDEERVQRIAEIALAGGTPGFLAVDEETTEKYLRQLLDQWPLEVVERMEGPVPGSEFVIVRLMSVLGLPC